MDLPLEHTFRGWSIRYNLINSDQTSASNSKTKRVVFVHGTPWSSIVYDKIIKALLANGSYNILVYDLPGYGQSQAYNLDDIGEASPDQFLGDTSVKFQAEALGDLLKHVKLDAHDDHPAPTVIAHDIAGAIVLRAHLLHDCQFESMLLMDTNAVLPWGDGFYKLARSESQTFLQLPPKIYEAMLRAVIQSACHNPDVIKAGWQDLLAQPWLANPEIGHSAENQQRSFIRQIAQADDKDVAEMLDDNLYQRVRCDVKIIWGEQDQWIPKHKIEELIERLNGRVKSCAYIPEAGHLVMLDQPERVAIEIFTWLNRGIQS